MADPDGKASGVSQALEALSEKTFGRSRTQSIIDNICVICGEDATDFRDDVSRREYTISGMCQMCQDKVFGG